MLASSQFGSVARLCLLIGAVSLSGCAASGPDLDPHNGIYDPNEAANRKVHNFNRGLDRTLVRPASKGYTSVLPDEVEDSIGNFATNLGTPSVGINSLLQGDMQGVGLSATRFLLNSTLGLFGLIDVASEFGVDEHDTNFGETLHVWGATEGPYVELPFLGPSTQRDVAGKVVDLFTNPLSYALDSPESYYSPAASIGSGLGTRGRYADTIDSVLYDSADSYAQARLIYMQNRRFELGQEDQSAEIDPFELDTQGF
ncbi:MAG: VacJ family lipoprotein [Aliishimia sp.]